jgi:integrase
MSAIHLFQPGSFVEAGPTVPEVVIAFLAVLRVRVGKNDYDPDNYLNSERDLTRLAAAYPIPVSDCNQKDLVNWIDRNPQWKSGHTKKGVVNRILACFNWAADSERGDLIAKNPFKRIQAVSDIPYEARRAGTLAEYVGLVREGNIALKRALFFIYRTGCRPCEMRELIWPWVIFNGIVPHLCLAKHKTIKKTGKPKLIGLDEVTVRFLRNLQARRTTAHQFVFTNCDGDPWSPRAFSQNLARCAVRAGLDQGVEKKVSAGCFRSTYACDLIEAGFTNREVADMLGHTTTDMVDQVYGSHTRQRAAHLGRVANDAQRRRAK